MAENISKGKILVSLSSKSVIALSAFLVNLCLLGVLRSNAVIYSALVDTFDSNRQYAAWPAGFFGFFMSITGLASGFLSRSCSLRGLAMWGVSLASLSLIACSFTSQMQLIILFYGALQGIGFGLVVPITQVLLNQNFSKYRAFAVGIASSGSSAGSFMFSPLSNYLLETYDLDGTFLLLGGIMLNSLVGAMLYKTRKRENLLNSQVNPKDSGPQNDEKVLKTGNGKNSVSINHVSEEYSQEKSSCLSCRYLFQRPVAAMTMDILSNPSFFIISLAYTSYFTTSAIFSMVILDFAKDRGVKAAEGVFIISAYSFGNIAGRLALGWVADIKLVRRSSLVRLYLLIMGVLIALFPMFPKYAMFPSAVALGVINGAVIVNHSVLFSEYLGLDKLPLAMGFSTCILGLSAFLRPVIIGYFRDYHQSYDHLFLFLGMLQVCVVAVWCLEVTIPFVCQITYIVNKQV